MIGGFQYDITLGPYQQERLHAMTGTFVIHHIFGALSAAVMTGHYTIWRIVVLYNTVA